MKLSLLAIVTTLAAGLHNDSTNNEHLYITPYGQTINNSICLTLHDQICEQSTSPYLHSSQQNDVPVALHSFDKNCCHNNAMIPAIDRDLIENLSDNKTNLKKDCSMLKSQETYVQKATQNSTQPTHQNLFILAGLHNDSTNNENLYITPYGQTTNNFVCLVLHDQIYEQSTSPYLHSSQQNDVPVALHSFDKNGCYNNAILPAIDKDLIENLSDNKTNLKKDCSMLKSQESYVQNATQNSTQPTHQNLYILIEPIESCATLRKQFYKMSSSIGILSQEQYHTLQDIQEKLTSNTCSHKN